MTFLRTLGAIFLAWTNSVAAAIVGGLERVVSPRVVRLVEEESDVFRVEATDRSGAVPQQVRLRDGVLSAPDLAPILKGSRIEIILQPKRVLFRPLELPSRAADFLDGIVRAQIDRLTPWTINEAVFGCSSPVATGGDSITTIVAVTTRKIAAAYVHAVSSFHPAAVAICANIAEHDAGRVKLFEQSSRGHLDVVRLGRVLLVALAATAMATVVSLAVSAYMVDDLAAQEDELARQVAQRRAAIRAGGAGESSPTAALERRKHETPSNVIVLDALSRVLPDHTYVTELHVQGGRIQVSGITGDAPSLISLIEQSRHFTRATFYAPTTRAASDSGDRFHIEASIQPNNVPNP
ncbi:PilN domain-containing protein [Bradyrhizobium prioriisuperbiae]|uniref:PilN domain-containing protein n=1 Tax=Bradyrhizobium prioriisuperbiae TaxID=2854389 RepID=UPI0028E679F1|nr:PilN domain-containing protein [Bradyrhizobium prioritasuperba]